MTKPNLTEARDGGKSHGDGMVLSLWRGLIPAHPRRVVYSRADRLKTMRDIVARVAWEHNLSISTVMFYTGRRPAHARQEAMWRIRQERYPDGAYRYSFPAIGRFFGLDHSTVMYACREVEKRMAKAALADQDAA